MLNKAFIDLNKLRNNASVVKAALGKVKLNAVVKADGYGHGAEKIASALYLIADSFSVATVEEGKKLRLSGIDKEILVFTEPAFEDAVLGVFYNLTLTVSKIKTLHIIERAAKAQNTVCGIHIKVNTGMNRYGLNSERELNELLLAAAKCKNVYIAGVYSHLFCPESDRITDKQLKEFLLASNLVKSYNKKVISHISASGGFLKGHYFDMCRIGILLYGYKPFKENAFSVSPVMKISAPVIETRTVKKGEYLSYGKNRQKKDVTVSLARFGYADGLMRDDKTLPVKRCMDVSFYYGRKKEVFVLDGNADKLARKNGTISYEILCNATKRAELIYIN